jgi:ABC-type multidrug transport system fused ATPase/permease subunit
VEFRDVCFAYGDTEVLNQVSAVLEPGTVTALVGPSGSASPRWPGCSPGSPT